MGSKFTQEDIMKLLGDLYDKSIHGFAKVSPPSRFWRKTIYQRAAA